MPHAPRASAASASAVLVVVLVLVLVGVAVAAVLVVVLPVVVLVGRTQRTQRERRLAGGRCWNGCPRAVVAGQSLRWECQRRSARRHRGGHLGWHVERPLLCQCRQRQESRDGHGRGHCRGQQQPGRSFIAEFFFPFFLRCVKKNLPERCPWWSGVTCLESLRCALSNWCPASQPASFLASLGFSRPHLRCCRFPGESAPSCSGFWCSGHSGWLVG